MDEYFIIKATLNDKKNKEVNFVSKKKFNYKIVDRNFKGVYIMLYKEDVYKLIDKSKIIDIDVNRISYYEYLCFKNIVPSI
jgi:hypothetical protein